MPIRYLPDEHIANAVASALRRRDIDVVTAHEAGSRGLQDQHVLEAAAREQRVLVTNDAHFARLHAERQYHTGIVYCPSGSRSVGTVVRYLVLIHDVLTPEEMIQRIEYV